MKLIQLIVILSICGVVLLQCKKQNIDEEVPEEVNHLTQIDSVTTASQNIKFTGYQAQCFEEKISPLKPNEPFTINNNQTYTNYFGCHNDDLPAIDFSKQTLLIANIPRTCIPGFTIKQSIVNNNGHLNWNVKFPTAYGCNDGTIQRKQVCYLYEGVIYSENITLTIKK